MNTEQLEQLLSGGTETPNFDIKTGMPWDCSKLVKHMMAMSNVRDGGILVIGVEDGTFTRTGVTDSDRGTYKKDIMQDQVATYADPDIQFDLDFPIDASGLRYVVINIKPFRDVPIICKKDDGKTKIGAIYYRSQAQRPSSKPIDNSYDMRDLLNLAASRTAARNRSFGFVPAVNANQFNEQLDAELGGL